MKLQEILAMLGSGSAINHNVMLNFDSIPDSFKIVAVVSLAPIIFLTAYALDNHVWPRVKPYISQGVGKIWKRQEPEDMEITILTEKGPYDSEQ